MAVNLATKYSDRIVRLTDTAGGFQGLGRNIHEAGERSVQLSG